MADVLVPKDRHVVPNFRSFGDTVALGELDPEIDEPRESRPTDLSSRFLEWSQTPSLGLAGDILSAAIVGNVSDLPLVTDAATFVLANSRTAPGTLVDAAERLLGTKPPTGLPTSLPRLATFVQENARQEIHRKIKTLRHLANRFGWNPIPYAELARLYLTIGEEAKARRNISIALRLAPFSRFVLRSAARLYAHCNDAERAFELLRRNPRTLKDPWLLSAELALAGLVKRPGVVMRDALHVLASESFSPLSLSELRAGVGSVHFEDGNRKLSRRLLQRSLERPTDNSLAQVEWLLSRDRLFDLNVGSFEVKRNFEALALESFRQRRWQDVVHQCESWLVDTPFSSRPVFLASHVAAVVLEDFEAAKLFCQAGRLVAPDDPQLANAHAYALALGDDPHGALKALDAVPLSAVSDERARVCLTATRGLAYYRLGRVDEGRGWYSRALEGASKMSDQTYWQLALLNFVREEMLAKQRIPAGVVERIREMQVPAHLVTTEILRKRIVDLAERATETLSSTDGV